MKQPVAIVMSEEFLRRLTPSLIPFVRRQQDFRVINIHRPIEELRQLLLELEPCGLITEWLPEITESLLQLKIPTVIADTDMVYPGSVSVDVDDYRVGAEAADAFRAAGFKSFACVGNGLPYSDQRREGFEAICGDGLPFAYFEAAALKAVQYSESFVAADEALIEWLQALPKPVGIFAVHDPVGRHICAVCQTLGLKIPEEVAVIGANNDELVCGLSYPMLSSVAIPWDEIGSRVVEALRELLAGKAVPDGPILVPPGGVVLRHSANYLAIEDPLLRRAMSYLTEHLQEPLTVGTMCKELRCDRRSLERKFREFYQCSPWEMLCRIRVRRAKALLVETGHPISLISELSGFNDPERMAVVFKRLEGVPPSSFRRKL